ncbi:MAG: Gfo/Idh/MocA family oxidoreductase [Methanospirillum sp.]|nr:Gfo/Idh/MocA family oxidoreductase [Methanospirillum sp.]
MEIGVLGTGTMGRNHVRIYASMKAVDRVRVYDLDGAAAREVAEKNGAVASASADDLLRRVDAVSVCVPTQFHLETARSALARGVHVLVEKPVCGTAREARELAGAVPDGLVAGVGHIERFNPIVTEVKRILRRPLYVEAKRHNPASSRITGSSVVEDLMIHDIDVMGHLFPGIEPDVSSLGTLDVIAALLRYGDVPVSLSASRKSSKKIRSLYVEEEDLTIEGDYMSQEVTVYRRPDAYESVDERYVQENVIEKVLVNKVEPLALELATFVECVRTGRPFPITLGEGAANLEVCERIAACFSMPPADSCATPAAGPTREP